MSETSSDKQLEDSASLDGDSGHDSVDEISSERERIACLETAVNWIRDEVVSVFCLFFFLSKPLSRRRFILDT